MKYIIVTWWVMSGTGKGIVAASLWVLLKHSWVGVEILKCDPYLQIDAGTMSPYEHGEVFVTHDGGEVDLDFGHYERFLWQSVWRQNSITTWQIYADVIAKERKWAYLGQTVQVVPHIVNEVKDRIKRVTATLLEREEKKKTEKKDSDRNAVIIEIGWTVWDMEGPHFFEAVRQLRAEYGRDVCFVHVAPLVRHSHSGEVKTKPLQHSIQKLREIGIIPDFVICRTPSDVTEIPREKIAMLTWISHKHCIHGVDMDTVYAVPLGFAEQDVHTLLFDQFWRWKPDVEMTDWSDKVSSLRTSLQSVTICLAGKYTHLDDCYLSVVEALKHASWSVWRRLELVWLDTEASAQWSDQELDTWSSERKIQWVVVPGWFGERGVEGMIWVAEYCHNKKIPYLGICLGMQVAVIAHARRHGLDAYSAEFETAHIDKVIALMDSQASVVDKWWTMRLWSYEAQLAEGSHTADLYNTSIVSERHRHRYEVNPQYHEVLEKTGLTLSWLSPDGRLVEFIEYSDHPYFVATQAHPEFLSTFEKAHPLFVGLVEKSSIL